MAGIRNEYFFRDSLKSCQLWAEDVNLNFNELPVMQSDKTINGGMALLKFIASLGIVGCHLNMRPATSAGEALLYFSDTNVAIFGVLSGFFLAQSLKKTTNVDLFKKKSIRLLPVYFAWTIFYLLIKIGLDLTTTGVLSKGFGCVDKWFYIVFWGGASAHLWYLASLYYISVLLSLLRAHLSFLWSPLMAGAFIWVTNGWGGFYSWYPVRLFAFICAGIGVYQNYERLSRIPLIGWSILLTLGVVMHMYLPWRTWIPVYDVCMAVPLVLIFEKLCVGRTGWLMWLSECSFGIYLVYVAIAFVVGNVVRGCTCTPYSLWVVAMDWLIVISISIIWVIIMRRIDFLRRFVE